MLKPCPDPIDINDIQFKLHCSLKVFDNVDVETFQNNHSLVSCASRYGLLFAASNTPCLKVVQLKTVENYTHKDKEISNFPRRTVPLPSPAKHVCVNCDSTLLAVVVQRDNCPLVIFYDVLSFYKQTIVTVKEVRLSATPGTLVTEIGWNPAVPGIFTACKSDKILGVYELKGSSVEINELPAAAGSVSFSWSPKGKQIAVGSKTGTIVQYKPDLKAVRKIEAPALEAPSSLISLCWVSNFQFIGVYQCSEDAKLIVVDAPKSGEISYTNYDDVCYSGSTRIPQFYLILLQHWNLLMIASSNSMELGLLGAVSEVWTQWIVPDNARAELPLSSDKQDTLPVGMALDISNTKPLPWGEGTIPPCPYLLLLSHTGVLYFYNIANLKEGFPSINCPPDNVADTSGLSQFVVEAPESAAPETPPQPQQTFSFESITQPVVSSVQPTTASVPAKVWPPTSQPSFNIIKPTATQPTPPFGLPQTSAAPSLSLFDKSTEPQVTITPVKPQPQISAPSFFGSSVTLTPAKTQPQNTETSDKYASIFAVLKTPSAMPTPAETRPILIATKPEVQTPSTVPVSVDTRPVAIASKPELKAPEPIKISTPEAPRIIVTPKMPKTVAQEIPKTTFSEVSKTDIDPKSVIDEQVKGETQALLTKMVKDECLALESELKALLHQGRKIDVNIGGENEKVLMIKELQDLQEFIKEIIDVSSGESSEVHTLKQNLVLSWAWYEEALSRYNVSKDETMGLILKSQPLDSATEKRQSDIKKIVYYLDCQITQASKALDEQWDKFQDYTKKSYRVQMPTMETIFQTLVRQGGLLQRQSYILKDISSNIKLKKLPTDTSSLFVGLKKIEDLKYLKLSPDSDYRIIYDQILDREKKLTMSKTKKLRDFLKSRDITYVTAAKLKLNSSLIKSPGSKGSHAFSILGAGMSPVMKPAVVKNLNFSESTPLKNIQDIKPTMVPPNTPAQPDPSKTFTFKSLDKNVLPPSTSNFYPLSKTTSILSNLNQTPSSSAFVLTTQASKNFTPPTGLAVTVSPTVESPSIQTLSQFSFDTSSLGMKPQHLSNLHTTSQANVPFSFKPNVEISTSEKNIVELSTALPTFTATTQGFFSFGKPATPSVTTANLKSVSTPAPSTFSSATPALVDSSTSIFTAKPIPSNTTTLISPLSTTLINQVTPAATISKPPLFASTSTIKNTSATFADVPQSTPISFSAMSTTSVASTTTTTSQFGLISSPSVSTSFFSTKPPASTNISSFAEVKPIAETDKSLAITTESNNSNPVTVITSTTTMVINTTQSSSSPLTVNLVKPGFIPVASSSTTVTSGNVISTKSGSVLGSIPATTSTKSIFSNAPPTTTVSVFSSISANSGTTPSTVTLSGASVMPTSSPVPTGGSVFGKSSTVTESSILEPTGTNLPPLTVKPKPTVLTFLSKSATTQASPFGSSTTSQSSIFATPTTQSSIFGSTAATQSSIFATPTTTQSSIFATPTTTQSPLFITPTTTQSSIFSTPTTTQPSIFGTTTTTKSPAFDTTTTQSSTFSATVTQPSIFGATTTTQSIFATATTSESSIFGTPSTTQTSIFGTQTSQASVFGANTSNTPSSVFGNTTQASIFGGNSTTTQSSVFGVQPTGSIFSSTSSAFGAASPVSTQGSIFGAASPVSSSSSIFGSATTTSSGFGQTTGSIFGSSGFGTTATTTAAFGQPAAFGSTSGSIFGTPATSSSVFGTGSNAFGTASTSNSVFGSAPTSTSFSFASGANNPGSLGFGNLNVGISSPNSIFGGAPTFNQSSPNPFARSTSIETTSTGSIFGSGGANTFGTNSQSTFGSTTFGSSGGFGQQSSFGQNTFGQQSSFGTPQAGPFSGGGVGVSQTGFGSPGGFPKTGGFGGAPVFGGSPQPAFGGSPNFTGAPAFGGAPTFGSPSKVFGSSTPSASFGNTNAGSPGFGNLANQNTVGFGNLAQQAATSTAAPFSGSSSFSSWR